MSKCPYCGFDGCYNSGFSVECANPCCDHCTVEQLKAYIQEELRRRILQTVNGEKVSEWDSNFRVENPQPAVVSVTPRGFATYYFDLNAGLDPVDPPPPTESFLKKQEELREYFKTMFAGLGLS